MTESTRRPFRRQGVDYLRGRRHAQTMTVLAAVLSLPLIVDAQTDALRAIVQAAKRLPLTATEIAPKPPRDGWAMGMVSWVAADRDGLIYILQRGDRADPIVVMR